MASTPKIGIELHSYVYVCVRYWMRCKMKFVMDKSVGELFEGFSCLVIETKDEC